MNRQLTCGSVPICVALFVLGVQAAAQGTCGAQTDPADALTQVEVCVVDQPTYAAELFGPGADALELSYVDEGTDGDDASERPFSNRPKVLLELPDRGRGADDIGPGARAVLVVNLQGAVFAERVRTGDLTVRHLASTDVGELRVAVVSGGAQGDDSVSFEVQVDGADGLRNEGELPVTLALAIPRLTRTLAAMSAPSSRGILVRVALEPQSGTDGFPEYPGRGQTLPNDSDADTGVRVLVPRPLPSDRALTIEPGGDAETGIIDPEVREVLVFTPPRDPQVLTLATIVLALDPTRRQADGTPFSVSEGRPGSRDDGAGVGVLQVRVSGEFREGDVLIFDIDGDGKADDGERFSVGERLASVEFPLEQVVPGTYNVRYFPNREDPLRAGALETSVAVAFDHATNLPPAPVRMLAELQYLDADSAVPVHGIWPPSSMDRSYVRVRCGGAVDCRVYMACDSAEGAHHFGRVDPPIGAWSVETLTAERLAGIIGATEADFAGGMTCDVIGSDISVQVLTRSGGVLTNSTYVGRPLGEEGGDHGRG